MNEISDPQPAAPLRILRFPLTRLVVLGFVILYMMAMSNGFMQQFKGETLKLTCH